MYVLYATMASKEQYKLGMVDIGRFQQLCLDTIELSLRLKPPSHIAIPETSKSVEPGGTTQADPYEAYMVMPHEAEYMIENLTPLPLQSMGSAEFMRLHGDVEKLNLQAHQSAKLKSDNFVVESLLTFKKLPVLIYNLLANELWKEKVFPTLADYGDAASMRTYFVVYLYHEAVLCNLLEVSFYHEHVVESLDDETLMEVVDYCMRKITWLIQTPREVFRTQTTFHKSGHDIVRELDTASRADELRRQWLELEFRVSVQCVTILRYICERVHLLSLNLLSRVLDKHDALLSFVALLENPPWTYKAPDNTWKKFDHQKWTQVAPCDLLQITTTEAQPWIALYFLVCSKAARDQYQLTSFRKNQVLRVRKYLNDVMLDQLPLLADVQRFLDELAIVQLNPNAVSAAAKLVMEVVPVIRTALVREYRAQYTQLGVAYLDACASINRQDDMKTLADVYNMDGLDDLLDSGGGATSFSTDQNQPNQMPPAKRSPLSVNLVISNHDHHHMQKIIALDDSNCDSVEQCVICDVVLSSETVVDTTDGKYFRYALQRRREVDSTMLQDHEPHQQDVDSVVVATHAHVHATVAFDDNQMPPIHLANPDVNLPVDMISNNQKSTAKPVVWRQVGVLDQGQGVVQMQLKLLDTNRLPIPYKS
ncbi:hypothetical protein DYB37_010303 [Aphanomyces astaci]|uniref:Uncharacterized protein n=1 Tax=Aphanomyces astaci TaxID=112090 RepID=A0A3R7C4B8_APHAT|nr:hypothetical protein DYB37_010303 [Aphanomyces astaci]